MFWNAKVAVALTLLVVSLPSLGQKYVFSGEGDKAGITTKLLQSRSGMPSVEVQLSLPMMDVEKLRDGFDVVSAPGLYPLDEAGNPELFTVGRMIAVPQGYELNVQVLNTETREIADVLPRPAQRKLRCDGAQEETFAFNTNLYEGKGLYPRQNLTVENLGNLGGFRLVRIGMYPVQANLENHSLVVTTNYQVRVDFRKVGETKAVSVSPLVAELLRTVPANGASLSREFLRAQNAEVVLAVVADSLMASMQPYVAWKQAKGIKVEMVNFTTAGGTKEKVSDYIKNYYATAAVKPSYLLFVGNKDTMPAFNESTASGSAATDYTYTLLNKDSKMPALGYGRLVADNVDEVKLQLDRWIAYERTPEKSAPWYHDGVAIASDEGSNPSDKEYGGKISDALKAGTYKKVDGFYQGDDNATFANISGALKEGRSWISYFGHGSGTSWGSTNDSFSVTQVGKLDNTNRLPVIIDVACQNASWVKLSKCFGKAWVTQTSGGQAAGAVAFYGGSVNISWHPPAIMSVGIAKYHFEKPLHSLGSTVLAGQMYLVEQKGTGADTMDNVKWYNLFGDPSMMIRTDTPKAYDVKQTMNVREGGLDIQVMATDGKGAAVKGVLVSLIDKKMASLGVASTNAEGKALITLAGVTALEPGTTLTTTGYNLETMEIAMK